MKFIYANFLNFIYKYTFFCYFNTILLLDLYLPRSLRHLPMHGLIRVFGGAYDRHIPSKCMPLALHQPLQLFRQDFLSQYTSVNRITSFKT